MACCVLLQTTLLLNFLQRFVENANVGACHNELLMLEHGEVQSMLKLRATSCLFSAIENCQDAVEITSLDHDKSELQVEVQTNNLDFNIIHLDAIC